MYGGSGGKAGTPLRPPPMSVIGAARLIGLPTVVCDVRLPSPG
ncbi:hypothetical protein BST28156_06771 [Burkholderia stagnalis]|nr:hypothetical protein BST28156_06771 [Burkholderia stagnalis]